jgi:hypothetical protein
MMKLQKSTTVALDKLDFRRRAHKLWRELFELVASLVA